MKPLESVTDDFLKEDAELQLLQLTENKVLGLANNTLIIGVLKTENKSSTRCNWNDLEIEKHYDTNDADQFIRGYLNPENGFVMVEKKHYQLARSADYPRLNDELNRYFLCELKEPFLNPVLVYSVPFLGTITLPVLALSVIFIPVNFPGYANMTSDDINLYSFFSLGLLFFTVVLMFLLVRKLRKMKVQHEKTVAFTLTQNWEDFL